MPHAELTNPDDIRVDVQTEFRDKELIKTIPGARWDGARSLWTVPRSWAACLQLRTTFQTRLTTGPNLRAWARTERARVTESVRLRDLMALEDDDYSSTAELVRSWRIK
jgi:hypothetical protein